MALNGDLHWLVFFCHFIKVKIKKWIALTAGDFKNHHLAKHWLIKYISRFRFGAGASVPNQILKVKWPISVVQIWSHLIFDCQPWNRKRPENRFQSEIFQRWSLSFWEGERCVNVVACFTQVHHAFSQTATWQQGHYKQLLGLKSVCKSDSEDIMNLLCNNVATHCYFSVLEMHVTMPKASKFLTFLECSLPVVLQSKWPIPSSLLCVFWSRSRNRHPQCDATVTGLSWLRCKRTVLKSLTFLVAGCVLIALNY